MANVTETSATSTRRYKQKENVWFDDGREEQLLAFVQSRYDGRAKYHAADILRLIDEYGVAHKYMMNVGAEKGHIVTSLIEKHRPKVMIEFGGYVGYSTLLFADALRKNGGLQYISFEREPKFARIAQSFIEIAGLDDIVRIVVGSSSKNLLGESSSGRLGRADMIFLDHYKPAYVRDLKICESLGIVQQGTVLAADNVISPGNPTYLEYVRSTPAEKFKKLAEDDNQDGRGRFPERTANQYKEYEKDDTEMAGVPGIEYESRLVHSHEPTGEPDGVEITICSSVPSN